MENSNIFHTDLEEAALLAKPSFLLNVVVDDNYNIIKAVAGDMVQAPVSYTHLDVYKRQTLL